MSASPNLVERGERRIEKIIGNPTIGKIAWMIGDFVRPFASRARKLRRRIRYKVRMAIGHPTL